MAFLELFECVAEHVRRSGAKVAFRRGKPLRKSAIATAGRKLSVPIPGSMIEFYQEMGDGMLFRWMSGSDDGPFAMLEIPKLSERASQVSDAAEFTVEWDDSYEFSHTKDPILAKQTARRMRSWIPFCEEGNGDCICLDASTQPAKVVFNQHDWHDGGTGENGHVLAPSLYDFLRDWSLVCFQFPKNSYWPEVFPNKASGIMWGSKQFRMPFRIG